jgi:hypothetical protein
MCHLPLKYHCHIYIRASLPLSTTDSKPHDDMAYPCNPKLHIMHVLMYLIPCGVVADLTWKPAAIQSHATSPEQETTWQAEQL